ncbi:hypothetical protein B0H14DRAFT_2624808 [Mycena olivaceomarginata]|nr:hypothetical protein B0H14DRAFT_2627327 [Mycena olivaceomarginata]KAJ7791631.1 hypothetical protein B0H14DRAFT_2624808 [Mycena olivaceomarginata]
MLLAQLFSVATELFITNAVDWRGRTRRVNSMTGRLGAGIRSAKCAGSSSEFAGSSSTAFYTERDVGRPNLLLSNPLIGDEGFVGIHRLLEEEWQRQPTKRPELATSESYSRQEEPSYTTPASTFVRLWG